MPTRDPELEALLDEYRTAGLLSEEQLDSSEIWWRDHQVWLQESGYMLRPRYHPGWIPSWKVSKKDKKKCEDRISSEYIHIMDGTRLSDGTVVIMKRLKPSEFPLEETIMAAFSEEPHASNTRNHCVPLYDVLHVPDDPKDSIILVMPLLRRAIDPNFDSVGEAVEFFRQIFEGVLYLHQNNVAHRDISTLNVMMDPRPLYPRLYHPFQDWMKADLSGYASHRHRTRHPVKYYLIDFGFARHYKTRDPPPRQAPRWGGDKSVPEHQSSAPCNPFAVDVYCLGNLIRQEFTVGTPFSSAKQGLEFMEPLLEDMTHTDPKLRPTMEEVVARFETIMQGLSSRTLRSPVVDTEEDPVLGFFRAIGHWWRRIQYVVTRTPAIPPPPSC
ncbi:hypothetical protein HGRIS_013855 [Hohenbuehelia grisea]|uniref:Protein kinase domain-containing protein n=1 Tax=Hohenbuehelia grisea TaxID=104357 RepID=A0ABR3IWM8_9AGAR